MSLNVVCPNCISSNTGNLAINKKEIIIDKSKVGISGVNIHTNKT